MRKVITYIDEKEKIRKDNKLDEGKVTNNGKQSNSKRIKRRESESMKDIKRITEEKGLNQIICRIKERNKEKGERVKKWIRERGKI